MKVTLIKIFTKIRSSVTAQTFSNREPNIQTVPFILTIMIAFRAANRTIRTQATVIPYPDNLLLPVSTLSSAVRIQTFGIPWDVVFTDVEFPSPFLFPVPNKSSTPFGLDTVGRKVPPQRVLPRVTGILLLAVLFNLVSNVIRSTKLTSPEKDVLSLVPLNVVKDTSRSTLFDQVSVVVLVPSTTRQDVTRAVFYNIHVLLVRYVTSPVRQISSTEIVIVEDQTT